MGRKEYSLITNIASVGTIGLACWGFASMIWDGIDLVASKLDPSKTIAITQQLYGDERPEIVIDAGKGYDRQRYILTQQEDGKYIPVEDFLDNQREKTLESIESKLDKRVKDERKMAGKNVETKLVEGNE